MSHPGKVEFMRKAQEVGYRVYLYYIATSDPEINKCRIRERVSLGGHDVPADLVERRYYRSLQNLSGAIEASNRAYIFDNSQHDQEMVWFAEVTDGREVQPKASVIPEWFYKSVPKLQRMP
jgi:predicted ABC-type ATPase